MQADRPRHRAAGIVAACGLAAILSAAPSGGTGPADDPFDTVVRTVLSQIALERADLGYDPAVFIKYPVPADEDCRLPWIADLLSDPMQIPAFSYDLVKPIRENPHSLADLIAVAAAALDQPASERPGVASSDLTDAIDSTRRAGGAAGPVVADTSTWQQLTDQKVLSFGADIERPLSVRLWPKD